MDETSVGDSGDDRWVLQNLGDTRRVGRVLVDQPGNVQIEFLGGDRVLWDALPKSARYVDPTGLAFRAAAEPEAVRAQLDADPAALALAVLQEVRSPVDAVELRQRLAGLGLVPPASRPGPGAKAPDPWPDLWRRIRPQLLSHAHVRVDGKKLAWSETPLAKASPAARPRAARPRDEPAASGGAPGPGGPTPLTLLERLATAGVDVDERQSLRQQAREVLRSNDDPYLAAALVALGVAPAARLDWSATPPPSEAAPTVATEVLRLARRQEAWRYLVAAATTPASSSADKAHALLDRVPAGALGVAAAEELDEWSRQLVRGGAGAGDLAARLELLGGLLPGSPPVAAAAALLRLLVALPPGPAASRAGAAASALLSTATEETTERALAAAQLDDAAVAALLAALSGHPAGPGTARARLLELVAASRPHLASSPEAWRGLEANDLVHLAGLPAAGRLLTAAESPTLDSLTLPLLARLVDSLDLDGLLGARHWPPALVALVDSERYAEALRTRSVEEGADLLAEALGALS